MRLGAFPLRTILKSLVVVLVVAALGRPAGAADMQPDPPRLAQRLCESVASAVDAGEPNRPLFVASYRPGPDESEVPLPLRSSAFAYDNALGLIALVACRDASRARRIGDAFLGAVTRDRTFGDGRIRNAYRAGTAAPEAAALLPGWWDDAAKLWAEDPYQDGSATGNVAWVALALLTLHGVSGDQRDLAAARTLLGWIAENTRHPNGPGFTGGLDGFDPVQTKLTWMSTEHNVDIYAAARWYERASGDRAFAGMAASARAFLDKAFLPKEGCFVLGTTPEGALADAHHLALDTQLWPLLAVADHPPDWRRALSCAEQRLGVPGGFDFDNDRDGLWVEGTAQAAFAYRALGQPARSAQLLAGLGADVSGSGWLYATRQARISTGLMIGPGSTSADFFYYRRPHLGATAWAALAALGWNPFTGKRIE